MSKKALTKAFYLINGILFLLLFVVLATNLFSVAHAQVQQVPDVDLDINRAYNLFVTIMNWVFAFAIVLAVIIIIWGGVTYMTAGGDDTKLGAAKKRIIWGLVGVAIVIAAWGLINLISQFLGAGVQKPR